MGKYFFFFSVIQLRTDGQKDLQFLCTYTAEHSWAIKLLKTALNLKIVMHEFKIW
jgi:hypothetical protein